MAGEVEPGHPPKPVDRLAVLRHAEAEARELCDSLALAIAELENDGLTAEERENATRAWLTRARRLSYQVSHTLTLSVP